MLVNAFEVIQEVVVIHDEIAPPASLIFIETKSTTFTIVWWVIHGF